ncbi:hypothetical protein GCM10011316_36820 [Roseibium aquae]|uniref:Pilus assembly protein Flp/PilA n=1 Tax=Roseibium aquae TaxID=1323746 RepID=A0A916TNN9_9HYPH|nr:Flp family type IVb pilin [Roseibium aquae]GGB61482.1 hypothetical protein GCM10011316_36820 [Roseibium aquae]
MRPVCEISDIASKFLYACKTFRTDDSGATAVEYGLMLGLIIVAIMGTMAAIGTSIGDAFETISTTLNPPPQT